MSNEISSFLETNWKDEISFDIVAKNRNNVEATFDIVEKTKFYDKLFPVVATKSNVASTKSNVASTLLLVWTGLN